MTKSEVAIKYWENEVAKGWATKEQKLNLNTKELIVTSVYEAIPIEWNEYVAELKAVEDYEARFWQTYNRIRYLNTWVVPSCAGSLEKHMEVQKEINDLDAQLCGIKGGLYLNEEDCQYLLKMMM